ncbi:MAG: FGGY family carbohydrate kinase [Gemmatimonadota bacterium]
MADSADPLFAGLDVSTVAEGSADIPLFAGLDVSTQSCKLVVIEAASGALVHVDQVVYDRDLPHFGTVGGVIPGLGEGVSESDPRMWIEAVEAVLGRLADAEWQRERIRCISVSGQQHGLVSLASDGSLARPRSKLWNDFSTGEECQLLTDAVGGPEAMIAAVGNTQRTGYTAPKILHMRRREPEAYERAATLFLVHNYINWHLTGGPGGGVTVMEPGDTSGMALWHPESGRWSRRVMEAIDPDLGRRLPSVRPSDRTIGSLSPALAARFGLSSECRIDAGSGDNMYGAIGTGNIEPGIVTVSLGTSGTAYTFLEEPFIDPAGEIAAFADSTGHHLPLLCVSNMANGYDAFREEFELTHAEFDDLVRNTPVGNEGRLLLPWYVGERTPDLPLAAPLYFGFGASEFQPHYLARAVLEGHVLNLFDGFQRMPVTPREIRLTGGLSHSPSWCQAIADAFQAETVPVRGEGAALGAAIHAAWVWQNEEGPEDPGREADLSTLREIANHFVAFDEGRRAKPDPGARPKALLLHRLFRALSRRARGEEAEDPFLLRQQLLDSGVGP